ncbi:MAG: hypothetical protein AABX16_03105 [Nanoarchaeota archaeon]
MKTATLAKMESWIRPFLTLFPSSFVVAQYSQGRIDFLKKLKK